MAGRDLGLDVAAAVSKVKADKRAARSRAQAASKASKAGKSTASASAARLRVSSASTTAAAVAASAKTATLATKAAQPRQAAAIPLGQKQRYVHDLAKELRAPVSFADIKAKHGFSVDAALAALLRRHPLLSVDEAARTITYVPKYQLSGPSDMHTLIRRHPFGIAATELEDAHSSAAQHLRDLATERKVFVCEAAERGGAVIFPNDIAVPGGQPEESIRDLVAEVALPQTETEVDAALRAAGIRKAKRSTPRLKLAVIQDNRSIGRKRKQRAIRNVTNVHVAHLLEEEIVR